MYKTARQDLIVVVAPLPGDHLLDLRTTAEQEMWSGSKERSYSSLTDGWITQL